VFYLKALFHNVYDVKEENGRFTPVRFTDKAIAALYDLHAIYGAQSHAATGVSVAFCTDADEISFSYEYFPTSLRPSGMDVYENGVMTANIPLPGNECTDVLRYRKETAGTVRIEIFLPNNAKMTLWDFALGSFCFAEPAGENTILFLGDSITQSAYTATPSLSFASLASRTVGAKYINRGIGSLFYAASTLDESDKVKPDLIFCEFGANDFVCRDEKRDVVYENGAAKLYGVDAVPLLIKNAREYLEKLVQIYPDAKICVLSLPWDGRPYQEAFLEAKKVYNKELFALTKALTIDFLDCLSLTPNHANSHVEDLIHLNELGGVMAAQGLVKYLNRTLQ